MKQKTNTKQSLHQKILVLSLFLFCSLFAKSQMFQVIPGLNLQAGSSGFAPCPDQRWTRTVFLVTPANMAASGALAGQQFNYLNLRQFIAANPSASGNINIYLENTANTTSTKPTAWATAIAPMTNVANFPFTIPNVTGFYTLNFNLATFTYTGGGIYVAIEWSNPTGPLSAANGNSVNNSATGLALRAQTTLATAPATLASTAFRPELQMGFQASFDVEVSNVYSLGKLPIEYGAPTTISANVRNVGVNTMTNISVSCNVTGATNTFNDVVVIPSLASGASTNVSFANYSPTALSTGDIVTVVATAAGDVVPTNNTATWSQNVTQNVYTYKNAALANAGGVGFNTVSGDFVAKFNSNPGITPPYTAPPQINEIKVDFFATATPTQTYKMGIWDATGAGGTPGTLIWESPVLTQTAGTAFIPVPNVSVSGDYFVGVRQTGTVNISFAYQNENPIRPGIFYFKSTGAWTDFNASASPFRFSVEVTVKIPVPPNCAINFSPADASVATCFNPILSWGSGGGSPTGYDVFLDTSPADVANFDPIVQVSTNQPGTTFNPGTLLPNTTYYWAVLPQNADGPALSCGIQSFTTGSLSFCHCIPTYTGTICSGSISAVSINTLTNTSVCTPPAHKIYSPTGTLTTSLEQTNTYAISLTATDNCVSSVWIDYNQDGNFDASEWNQISLTSVAGSPSTANITIPATALLGNTIMRVRTRLTGNPNGSGDACISFGSGSSEDYVVTIIPPGPCSGTPNPGNTIASATTVCAGTTVNFSLQNPTNGLGVTYQWSNPSGIIAGATNSTYSQVMTALDSIFCIVSCGSNSGNSNIIAVNVTPFTECYCPSSATFVGDEEIYSVTFNGSSTDPAYANANGCVTAAPGPGSVLSMYSNFKTLGSLTSVSQGATIPFTIVEDECDGATYFAFGTAIWIDFDHSGTFDAGEQVFVEPTALVGPRNITGNITIPPTALLGQTVMRITVAENFAGATLTPCLSYSYGETEDFLINITTSTLCAGTPTPGNTLASTATACPNSTVNLTLQNPTNGTGVTYQWFNNGGAIAGATNSSYLATITIAETFYCEVTCSNGPSMGSSNPVSISINTPLNCYCAAGATNGCALGDEYIGNVSFNTINNSSICGATYTNYTSISTTVTKGSSYPVSVLNPNWFSGDQVSVWIDLNQDGILDDITEQFALTTGGTSGTDPFTGTITIPATAQTGSTLMRVRAAFTGTMTACGNLSFGEVEDYQLIIQPSNTVLSLNCFIEGYWDGTSAMLPVLSNQGQPNPLTDCDSITVELYNSSVVSPIPAPDYSTTALLHVDGTATATFASAISGNYYIVIKHRNALQTWSATAIAMAPAVSYNFTTAASQAYGGNQAEVATGVFALYSGDIEVDENMDLLDLGLVEADISGFAFGYLSTDVNGDGNVDLLDGPVLETNISNFIFSAHP